MSTTPIEQPDPRAESVGGAAAGKPVGHEGARVDVEEKRAPYMSGALGILLLLALVAVIVWMVLMAVRTISESGYGLGWIAGAGALLLLTLVIATGLTVISPGETRVVQFFGTYLGTIRKAGLLFTVPLTTKRLVSVRVQNFETNELKVNDLDGNPVNVAAIIVWQVADTARAAFAVEDHRRFVAVQSESALRHVVSTHPYDSTRPGEESLRGSTDAVAGELVQEVAARIQIAGLEVVEARSSALAYAPEIAQAMLQRQQASALLAAREKIVDGGGTIVQNALRRLEVDQTLELDEERRAQMVSNMLVVLTSDSRVSPVINAGTLYG